LGVGAQVTVSGQVGQQHLVGHPPLGELGGNVEVDRLGGGVSVEELSDAGSSHDDARVPVAGGKHAKAACFEVERGGVAPSRQGVEHDGAGATSPNGSAHCRNSAGVRSSPCPDRSLAHGRVPWSAPAWGCCSHRQCRSREVPVGSTGDAAASTWRRPNPGAEDARNCRPAAAMAAGTSASSSPSDSTAGADGSAAVASQPARPPRRPWPSSA